MVSDGIGEGERVKMNPAFDESPNYLLMVMAILPLLIAAVCVYRTKSNKPEEFDKENNSPTVVEQLQGELNEITKEFGAARENWKSYLVFVVFLAGIVGYVYWEVNINIEPPEPFDKSKWANYTSRYDMTHDNSPAMPLILDSLYEVLKKGSKPEKVLEVLGKPDFVITRPFYKRGWFYYISNWNKNGKFRMRSYIKIEFGEGLMNSIRGKSFIELKRLRYDINLASEFTSREKKELKKLGIQVK